MITDNVKHKWTKVDNDHLLQSTVTISVSSLLSEELLNVEAVKSEIEKMHTHSLNNLLKSELNGLVSAIESECLKRGHFFTDHGRPTRLHDLFNELKIAIYKV